MCRDKEDISPCTPIAHMASRSCHRAWWADVDNGGICKEKNNRGFSASQVILDS